MKKMFQVVSNDAAHITAEAIRPGDPLDPATKMGAMVDAGHAGRVAEFLTSGRATSRLVAGG